MMTGGDLLAPMLQDDRRPHDADHSGIVADLGRDVRVGILQGPSEVYGHLLDGVLAGCGHVRQGKADWIVCELPV